MSCSTCAPGQCATPEACAPDAGAAPRLPKTYRPVLLDGPHPRRGGLWRRWRLPVLAAGAFLLLAVLLAVGFLFFYHR